MRFYSIKCFINPLEVDSYNKTNGKNIVDEMSAAFIKHAVFKEALVVTKSFSGFEILLLDENPVSESSIDDILDLCQSFVCVCKINKTVSEISKKDVSKFNLNGEKFEKIKDYLASEEIDDEKTDSTEDAHTTVANESAEVSADSCVEEDKKEELMKSIRSLVSMDELKKWAEMICSTKEKIKDTKLLQHALFNMSYLLVVDSGNGCSKAGEIIGKMIAYALDIENTDVKESKLVYSEKDNISNIDTIQRYFDSVDPKEKVRVNLIHIDDFINRTGTVEWQKILTKINEYNSRSVFVFVVPVIENSEITRIHQKIDDIICNRVICIPQYSNEDYIEIFDNYFKKFDIAVSFDAHSALIQKIAEEKSDGKFYGIKTIFKICDEIIYNKILKFASGKDADEKTVTTDDISEILKNDYDDGTTGLEKLDSLVALQNVKNTVREIIANIKMHRKMNTAVNNSMHMMFSGPPGTGKTVVARVLGRIFKEEGILSIGDFYEVTRKDLVGMYVGHTAPKTALACRNAYGSILFIDEAYSLNGGDSKDYGREAINTLIAEMENNRDNLVVIFAGYSSDLEELMELNQGLRDRIPYKIEFVSYSRDELRQIFFMNFPNEFEQSEDFVMAASEYFRNLPGEVIDSPNFSNGRFVRNLAERVISKAALRCDSQPSFGGNLILTKSDFELASNDISAQSEEKDNRLKTIGFSSAI